jgi:hypothetical protein
MLKVTTVPADFDPYLVLRGAGHAQLRAGRRPLAEERIQATLLADYIEGWAEADPIRIADATAPGYRFDDPLVGTFSTLALPWYFAALRSSAGLRALGSRQHIGFLLRGPMHSPSADGVLQFWREAPRLGLTGTSLIAVGSHGVISERVAYDLNLASDQLRPSSWHR